MKESEAWDLLGQIIESNLKNTKTLHYICFYLNRNWGYNTSIPNDVLDQMMNRFSVHKETDLRLYGWANSNVSPPSWYQDEKYFSDCNKWRVMFCYAMAWEAWEEEMSAEA